MTEFYHAEQSPTTKTCTACHIEKPFSDFYKDRSNKDGYMYHCKACYVYRQKHPTIVQQPLFILSKVCKTCGIEKPIEEFYAYKETTKQKGGYRAHCKTCVCVDIHQKYIEIHPPKPVPVNGGKVCLGCKIEKPHAEFYKEKRQPDGLNPECKACINAYFRQRREKKGYKIPPLPEPVNGGRICRGCHIEKPLTEFGKEKRRSSGYAPRCMECLNAQSRAGYAVRDNEPRREQRQKWYEANKDRHREMRQKWERENRLKAIAHSRRYYARKREATSGNDIDYEAILVRDGNYCYICCGTIEPYHEIDFDHVIPLSRGGPHSEENVRVTHRACNRRKHDNLLEQMTVYQRRGVQ
jgi:hypothetical protein